MTIQNEAITLCLLSLHDLLFEKRKSYKGSLSFDVAYRSFYRDVFKEDPAISINLNMIVFKITRSFVAQKFNIENIIDIMGYTALVIFDMTGEDYLFPDMKNFNLNTREEIEHLNALSAINDFNSFHINVLKCCENKEYYRLLACCIIFINQEAEKNKATIEKILGKYCPEI